MKRHLLIIAICLLLGAVVNVAVAWAACCAADVQRVVQCGATWDAQCDTRRSFV